MGQDPDESVETEAKAQLSGFFAALTVTNLHWIPAADTTTQSEKFVPGLLVQPVLKVRNTFITILFLQRKARNSKAPFYW